MQTMKWTLSSFTLLVVAGVSWNLHADEHSVLRAPELDGQLQSGVEAMVVMPRADMSPVIMSSEYPHEAACLAPCGPPSLGPIWLRAEYLLWWTDGMDLPPLVTTGTNGQLGDPATEILFGNSAVLDESRSGFRIRGGGWFDCERCWGWQGEYWMLGNRTVDFAASSDVNGVPSLFRPFFNINPRGPDGEFDPPATEDAELVAREDVLAGTVSVHAFSELAGAGLHLRHNLFSDCGCVSTGDPCSCVRSIPSRSRMDLLLGYRYARLHEGLMIREDLTSLLQPPEQGQFDIADTFDTTNRFGGFDVGVVWERAWGCWSLEMLGRIALGNTQQKVSIAGGTTISGAEMDNGDYPGGLLAQRTNIGSYTRDVFSVMPELGITLGCYLRPRLKATIGYTFLYWSRVARPGEQIDLDVNPDLLPPEFDPFAGALRPHFEFRDTDFWAQGLNVGLQYGW